LDRKTGALTDPSPQAGGVQDFPVWSPDGDTLIFRAAKPKPETQLHLLLNVSGELSRRGQ